MKEHKGPLNGIKVLSIGKKISEPMLKAGFAVTDGSIPENGNHIFTVDDDLRWMQKVLAHPLPALPFQRNTYGFI